MRFFRHLFAMADRQTFVELFLGIMQAEQPQLTAEYKPEEFAVVTAAGRINLSNFYAEYCQLPWHRRKAYLDRTVQIFRTVRDDLPEDFEDARQNLMPKLWMRSSFAHQALMCRLEGTEPPDLNATPVGEHLLSTIVYDLPNSMQTIPARQFEKWDISGYEAWEIAIENLSERTRAMAKIGDHLVSAVSGDNYDANRLFLVDRLRELGMDGHLVAMVPNRDTLYVTQAKDAVGLKMMTELADRTLQDEPRPMSPFPLQYLNDEWSDWQPPRNHILYSRLQEMRSRFLYGEYAEQKALLEKLQAKGLYPGQFMATFSVIQKKDSDEILSYAVWGAGVDTLLPEADRIVLMRTPEEILGFVPWSQVVETMGTELDLVPELYPKRYRVRRFPSLGEIEEMEPKPEP